MESRRLSPAEATAQLLDYARSLKFDLCGVAPATAFPELAHLDEWRARGYAGEMHYLHDPRRASPANVVNEARSVIVCALSYGSDLPSASEALATASANAAAPRGWISRYAWGDDYHGVLGEKLDRLVESMHSLFSEPFTARAYVDTGPVVERVAAKYAGLGWLGKNTCLINEKRGSFFFLGVIVTTLDLVPSLAPAEAPPPDLCGNCRLCLDACPTTALIEPYVLDARRCIAYVTIELRGEIPTELRERVGSHVFGCDICQDVCPWNHRATQSSQPQLAPRGSDPRSTFLPSLEWLAGLSQEEFSASFRGSPVKRAKWRGLVRNACVALGNSRLRPGQPRYTEVCAQLEKLAAGDDTLIVEHARWALHRLTDPKN